MVLEHLFIKIIQLIEKLVHAISIILISMLMGLSLLSILVVLHIFDASHIINKVSWVRWILYVVALFLPLFIAYTMINPIDRNNKYLGVYCTLVSSFEWWHATVLYLSTVIVDINIAFTTVIGIFIIALSGLVSFIPGGFGAFDLVVLLGLKSLGVPEEKYY